MTPLGVKMNEQDFISHEVRIRLLEKISETNERRFDRLETKIDSHFKWTLGIMITMFGGLILTKFI
jgi:hypothetical protein